MNIVNIISNKVSLKKTSLSAVFLGKTTSRENCLENLNIESFEKKYNENKNISRKKLVPKILTLECFDIEKLLGLISYIEDIITDESCTSIEEERKLKNQLAILKNIVSQSSYTDCFFQNNLLYRNMGYCYVLNGDIGRLYSYMTSIPAMSRDIRFLLFQKIYVDVDMVNAHPSILAKYAFEKGIETPTLLKLVNDRDAFYEIISEETNIDISEVKKLIIVTINQTEKMFFPKNGSTTLSELFFDVLRVRNSIYTETQLKNNHFLFEKKRYKASNIEKKKVSIQSFYCQTQESESLLDLYKFLKDIEGVIPSHQLPLVFIPFFDGAYIRYDNAYHRVRLSLYIKEYNSKNQFIKFKEKSLEKEGTLLNETQLNRYIVLSAYLKKIPQKRVFRIMVDTHMSYGLVTDEMIDTILKESTALKEENLRLSDEISSLRRLFKEQKVSKEQKKEYVVLINDLVKKRKTTYNYELKGKIRFYVEEKVRKKLLFARKILLGYCTDEKTLNTFIEEKLFNRLHTGEPI